MSIQNTLTALINFSFQGENYQPKLEINLDALLTAEQDFSGLYKQLAQANGIDTYSYLFEVMESCEIEFSNPSGLAVAFLGPEGEFDLQGFKAAWKGESSPSLLELAQRHMKIADLDEVEGLEAALQAAYQAGQSSRHDR